MMKKFFLFVTAVLTIVGCGDSSNGEKVAPERYGWDGPDLYGNVKSVTVTSYNLSSKFGEEIIGDEVQNDVYNFDSSHGNVISKNSVDKSDSTLVYEDYTYTFDAEGHCIERQYDRNGKRSARYKYVYDSDGNLSEESTIDANGAFQYKGIYKYDSDGNRIEKNVPVLWGYAANNKTTYTYDSKGNCIEENETRYWSDGSVGKEKRTRVYDSDGNCIEENETIYSSDGSVEKEKIIRVYDSDGNCIEMNNYNMDGEVIRKGIYEYDTDGKRIEIIFYDRPDVARISTMTYDSNGNCIEEKRCLRYIGILYPYYLTKYEIEYFE